MSLLTKVKGERKKINKVHLRTWIVWRVSCLMSLYNYIRKLYKIVRETDSLHWEGTFVYVKLFIPLYREWKVFFLQRNQNVEVCRLRVDTIEALSLDIVWNLELYKFCMFVTLYNFLFFVRYAAAKFHSLYLSTVFR